MEAAEEWLAPGLLSYTTQANLPRAGSTFRDLGPSHHSERKQLPQDCPLANLMKHSLSRIPVRNKKVNLTRTQRSSESRTLIL